MKEQWRVRGKASDAMSGVWALVRLDGIPWISEVLHGPKLASVEVKTGGPALPASRSPHRAAVLLCYGPAHGDGGA